MIFLTYPLLWEYEARNVDDVEEQVAHNVRGLGPGHFEAGAEPLVTGAVHHRVDPLVSQPVLCSPRLYTEGAAQVMVTAAPVIKIIFICPVIYLS